MSKTDADLGTLSEHEGEWQVTFVRRLHHPIEKVWRALTETEHMKAWFPDEMVGERRAGAPLKFISEQMNETYEGEMLVFEPQSVMELQWGPTNKLRVEVQPRRRRHRPHPRRDARRAGRGRPRRRGLARVPGPAGGRPRRPAATSPAGARCGRRSTRLRRALRSRGLDDRSTRGLGPDRRLTTHVSGTWSPA